MIKRDSRRECALNDESVAGVVDTLLLNEAMAPVMHQRNRRGAIVDTKRDGISEIAIVRPVLRILAEKVL